MKKFKQFINESFNNFEENGPTFDEWVEFFKGDKEAATIVKNWYDNEDTYGDFDNSKEFFKYVTDDIPNMLDAATDEKEYDTVEKALNNLKTGSTTFGTPAKISKAEAAQLDDILKNAVPGEGGDLTTSVDANAKTGYDYEVTNTIRKLFRQLPRIAGLYKGESRVTFSVNQNRYTVWKSSMPDNLGSDNDITYMVSFELISPDNDNEPAYIISYVEEDADDPDSHEHLIFEDCSKEVANGEVSFFN